MAYKVENWAEPVPTLMSDEILRGAIGKKEKLTEVQRLYLICKDIPRIENLWELKSLTRLYLSHNTIKKIEGLDDLVNLTWLSLAANCIEKIEGLELLQKLEVLNLSCNKISVIENMNTLESLTHFNIAKNNIEQPKNVLYLRRFKKLYSLTLFGNPFYNMEDYTLFIAAFFPDLSHLDSKQPDKQTITEAAIKYRKDIEEVILEEGRVLKDEEAKKKKEADTILHTAAFVESLNDSQLFETMCEADPEADTLHSAPGMAPLLQTFQLQMEELCTQLLEIGLTEHKQRETEASAFFSGQSEIMKDCQQKAKQILAEFDQIQQQNIEELGQISDPGRERAKIEQSNEDIDGLLKSLVALEFQTVNEVKEMTQRFDRRLSEMIGNFSEAAQGIFVQCRDLEDNYHEKALEIAQATLDKVAREEDGEEEEGEEEEELDDLVKILFADRDKVMDALVTSHENHLLKINEREALFLRRIDAWKVALFKEIQDKEFKNHPIHISDIHKCVDFLRKQLELPLIY